MATSDIQSEFTRDVSLREWIGFAPCIPNFLMHMSISFDWQRINAFSSSFQTVIPM
jgi:hypothetical protein